MINYIIINGTNSNTINGLGINELPPISKPPLRVQTEEIDGRDGDISTNLGYGAYDKTISIGLFGTGYDINEVISFFNGEGTVVFSNEPDMYYKYKIINQIDYEALLKFKSATITFHCQPFKYPLTETPLEIEYEYIEQEGVESATMNNTNGGTSLKINLKGNTSQDSTTGKNMFNKEQTPAYSNRLTIAQIENGLDLKRTGTGGGFAMYIIGDISNFANKTLTFSYNTQSISEFSECGLVNCNADGGNRTTIQEVGSGNTSLTTTIGSSYSQTKLAVRIYLSSSATEGTSYLIKNIQLEQNSSATTYEPYTNGASPNPDYPQQIHVVSGDNTIKVEGINLAYTGWASDFVSRINDNTKAKLETYDSKNCLWFDRRAGYQEYDTKYLFKIKWKENTQYTINVDYYNTGSNGYSNMKIIYTDNSEQEIYSSSQSSGQWNKYSITSQANKTIKYITTNWRTDSTYLNLDNFMVYEGTEEKSYQPYQSQTYPINLGVENIFNPTYMVEEQWNANGNSSDGYTLTDGVISISKGNGQYGRTFLNKITLPSGTYTIGYNASLSGTTKTLRYSIRDMVNLEDIVNPSVITITDNNRYNFSFTLSATTTIAISIIPNESAAGTLSFSKIQLEKGTKANHYTPYGQTPIELCKIGNYEDKIFKAIKGNEVYDSLSVEEKNILDYGKWYLRKAIGKVVLNGSEVGWNSFRSNQYGWSYWKHSDLIKKDFTSLYCVSNYFTYNDTASDSNVGQFNIGGALTNKNGNIVFNPFGDTENKLNDFKTWLGTHNTIVYYPLETLTNIKFNDTIQDQLEEIYNNMLSYEGQTNISQVNNDKPFLLDLIAMEKGTDEVLINNIGNTYAKPTIALEGTGETDIYLNNTEILKVDLSEKNKITIDTNNMEAYDPTDNSLANRKVIGNYNSMTLPSGNTTMKITGALTKATISNYTRWL